MACGHAADLPDVLSRRPQWRVSLCLPQGVAMAPIVQADGNAEAGFTGRRSPTLRNTEIAWGNGKISCPTRKMSVSVPVKRAPSGGDGAGDNQGDDDQAQQHTVNYEIGRAS